MPIFIPLFLKLRNFHFSRSRSIHSHLLIEIQFDSIELFPQPLNSHFFFKNREAQNQTPPFRTRDNKITFVVAREKAGYRSPATHTRLPPRPEEEETLGHEFEFSPLRSSGFSVGRKERRQSRPSTAWF